MSGRNTAFLPQEKFDEIRSTYARFNEPWLKDEIEELKAMAEEKCSIDDMATQMQRTPNSVKLKLKSIGLYSPPPAPSKWTEENDSLVIQLYNQGLSFSEIAGQLGRSEKAVIARLVLLRVKLFGYERG